MNKLLKIKQKETCLLTVDMQNEYLDPKNGTSPLSNQNIDRILKNTKKVPLYIQTILPGVLVMKGMQIICLSIVLNVLSLK